ncbi:hypothetical protein POM88_000576 [Heracleum sosnowskyi]|uniref:SecA Wing/Scaffold domain-containing protein n=1 Tax=Heracleum sosnowskyi TaxID=360622 RepID=A0AAD8JC50_9APIA|nr:hypothetical protein POM88_000576 [Heracleum sosnowskyi]
MKASSRRPSFKGHPKPIHYVCWNPTGELRASRTILVKTLDSYWRDHLVNMNRLSSAVNVRSFGHRNPLEEYKIDCCRFFISMLSATQRLTVEALLRKSFEALVFYFLEVMLRELKLGKHEKGLDAAVEKVIVAVKAAKEVPKNALVWALTHVVQPGDSILLVVVPSQSSECQCWWCLQEGVLACCYEVPRSKNHFKDSHAITF